VFVTTHVLAGAAIGAATRRPLVGLVLGAASHLALDAVPHWGGVTPSTFLAVAVADGLLGLAAMALTTRLAPPGLRTAVLAGAVGGALPDLDKPAELFVGRSPFPVAFDDIHGAIQREAPGWWWVEAGTAALVVAVLLVLLTRPHDPAERERHDTPRPGRGPESGAG
jgi:hypothetical protein